MALIDNREKPVRFLRDFPEFGIEIGQLGFIVKTYGWSRLVKNRKEIAKYKIYSVEYLNKEYFKIINNNNGKRPTIIVDSGDIKHGR